jgi:hypothetical protein
MKYRYTTIGLLMSLCYFVLFATACGTSNTAALISEIVATVGGIIPIAMGILSDLLPADQSAIASATTEANSILTMIQKLYSTYTANPGDSALTDFQKGVADAQVNLQAILDAAQVKNSKTAAKITNIVNGVLQSLDLIEANVAGKHPGTVAQAVAMKAAQG